MKKAVEAKTGKIRMEENKRERKKKETGKKQKEKK